ncbi:uncharacterized protein N7473_007200 [Penicillium subrubescens]|jgi:hypothetical protein|uniref:Aspirochlorine biosynthesis protein N n=1 Tax=Penicillium subrubescens TaxID=1316194 RepID=A0A1Q5T3X9_9EURO|nr:uncharacterized protein N7473_007200 [Penicillium subrubescens]KAJ5890972.1 hypothetical protein N7473_007200 [Penicillium subrubescens]OKO94932.1 hypothetical protein PENSUB_11335 [Penicillium subrubescens]
MSTTTTTTTTTATAVNTTASDYIPRGPTSAELTFYAPPADDSAPFNYVETPPPGQPKYNYGSQTERISLTDIRGNEDSFNLDKDSFQTLRNIPSATTYSTFDSETSIRETYYPEVESLLLKHVPNAHKIILFDHTIRRANPNSPRQPVNRVHVDQTPAAALARVNLHITDPAEAKALSEGRYRIINVWRPLTAEPVQSQPLAFASASSVDENDLVPIQHRYPDRTGETMGVKFNPGQKWFYWSGMTGDERLLLKCSDSQGYRDGDVAQWVPHTAFTDGRTPVGARPRESIEVRALVFG